MKTWITTVAVLGLASLGAHAYKLQYRDVPGTRHMSTVSITARTREDRFDPAAGRMVHAAQPTTYSFTGVIEERVEGRTREDVPIIRLQGRNATTTVSFGGKRRAFPSGDSPVYRFCRELNGALLVIETPRSEGGASLAGGTLSIGSKVIDPFAEYVRLPNEEINIGDVWESSDQIDLGEEMSLDVTSVNRLVGTRVVNGRTYLQINSDIAVTLANFQWPNSELAAMLAPDISMSAHGTIYTLWDEELGEILRSTTEITTTATMTFSGEMITEKLGGPMSATYYEEINEVVSREERPLIPVPSEGVLLAICPDSGLVATDRCPRVNMKRIRLHVPTERCALEHKEAKGASRPG